MTLPPLTTILAMYVAAIALLWIATQILAPKGQKISVLRCFGTAFALTFLGNASRKFLTSLVGDWAVLISFAVYVLIVMGLFRLFFWRSLLVTLIYHIGVGAFYYFFFYEDSRMTMTPNHALQRIRPSRSGCNPRHLCAGSLSLGR